MSDTRVVARKYDIDYEEEFDEVKIKSSFLRGIISKIVGKVVKDKLGRKVDVKLKDFGVKIDTQDARLYLELDVKMPREELKSLIFEKIGM